MTELICIVCPKGCHLTVNEENGFAVTGHSCEKGIEYGKTELSNPMRTITSTVKLSGGALCRCPVRSSVPIPKVRLFEVMEEINRVCVAAPVKAGQVLIANVLGTGADIIATRTIE